MPDCFIDTNVLLYAVSTDQAEASKTITARQLLQTGVWAWSAQVAAEFVRAGTSPKKTARLTWGEAGQWISVWRAYPMASVDGALVSEAVLIAERFMISYYDAQIVAAALRMQCPVIYTEDLNDGQDYGGVMAINPFKAGTKPT